jgi:hypothetical protein
MAKLLFDPITYQFYYRCPSEESAPATAAGFGWDPIRRRFYTEDPMVAMALASRGDNYVKHLLADALETTAFHKPPEGAGGSRRYALGTASISYLSNSTH